MIFKPLIFVFMSLSSILSSQSQTLSIKKKNWGNSNTKEVYLYTLTNSKGMVVEVTNYGAIVCSILAPDREGKLENIVLGFDNLEQYKTQNSAYMGAVIGRFANRIANASFTIDAIQYKLAPNDTPNHSHGGKKGFDKAVWDSSEIKKSDAVGVVLEYLSKDNEENYPGNLKVKVSYMLTNDNELKIYYEAQTDKPTILNLTHHGYFNLSGNKETILEHELTIYADSFTPTDSSWIPTGEIASVIGTNFDFTKPEKIGKRIKKLPNGYNMNFVLRKEKENELSKAAEVFDAKSGRLMQVFTTEPGLQLYTADYMNGSIIGRDNIVFGKNMGLALEAQHFPDAPNKSNFPSTELRPGQKYTQVTAYTFLTK